MSKLKEAYFSNDPMEHYPASVVLNMKVTLYGVYWIDKDFKMYKAEDITDQHLINILNFILKGGGLSATRSVHNILRLYDELEKRKLDYPYSKEKYIQMYIDMNSPKIRRGNYDNEYE